MSLIWLKVFQKISNAVTLGARSTWLGYRLASLKVCFVICAIKRVESTSNHTLTAHSRWEKWAPPPKLFRCGPVFKKTASFKGGVFFWGVKKHFGPNRLGTVVCVVWSREYVRSKAYYLKILFHTYNMVIRPIENFLHALEVETMKILASQKVA